MAKPKKKSSKDYRHGDLKSALIEAALESIAATGEVEFSLRDLSLRAGVTHAAAYRHFSSKKDILRAVAEQGYYELSERFRKILLKDPLNIEELGMAYVQFAKEHPQHFKVMFHPDVKAEDPNEPDVSLGEKTFGYLLASVEANKESGRFVDQDSRLIAMTAWAAVHGLASLVVNEALEKKMKIDSVSMSRKLTKNLMNGFVRR